MAWYSFWVVWLIIGVGLAIWGVTYTIGWHHEQVTSTRRYFSEDISTYIHIQYAARDAMLAGNPISVVIHTDSVKGIDFLQLTFDGADTYFPEYCNSSNATSGNLNLAESTKERPGNVVPVRPKVNADGSITFSGNATLVYYQGGNFDIGITFRPEDSGVQGYEMQQRNVKIPGAVSISPPETLLTIKTNWLITGISWLAVGVAMSIPAIIKIVPG